MNIVIIGQKGVGKSTIGAALAHLTDWPALETDEEIERRYQEEFGKQATCREIFRAHGADFFRAKEVEAVLGAAKAEKHIILTGGSTMMNETSRNALTKDNIIVYLTGDPEIIFKRAMLGGAPPWLQGPDAKDLFIADAEEKDKIYADIADLQFTIGEKMPSEIADAVASALSKKMGV